MNVTSTRLTITIITGNFKLLKIRELQSENLGLGISLGKLRRINGEKEIKDERRYVGVKLTLTSLDVRLRVQQFRFNF